MLCDLVKVMGAEFSCQRKWLGLIFLSSLEFITYEKVLVQVLLFWMQVKEERVFVSNQSAKTEEEILSGLHILRLSLRCVVSHLETGIVCGFNQMRKLDVAYD